MTPDVARVYYESATRIAHDKRAARQTRVQARTAARFWWRILQRKIAAPRRDTVKLSSL